MAIGQNWVGGDEHDSAGEGEEVSGWTVDEIAILNKIGAGAKENFVKSEITMATGVTMPYTIKN